MINTLTNNSYDDPETAQAGVEITDTLTGLLDVLHIKDEGYSLKYVYNAGSDDPVTVRFEASNHSDAIRTVLENYQVKSHPMNHPHRGRSHYTVVPESVVLPTPIKAAIVRDELSENKRIIMVNNHPEITGKHLKSKPGNVPPIVPDQILLFSLADRDWVTRGGETKLKYAYYSVCGVPSNMPKGYSIDSELAALKKVGRIPEHVKSVPSRYIHAVETLLSSTLLTPEDRVPMNLSSRSSLIDEMNAYGASSGTTGGVTDYKPVTLHYPDVRVKINGTTGPKSCFSTQLADYLLVLVRRVACASSWEEVDLTMFGEFMLELTRKNEFIALSDFFDGGADEIFEFLDSDSPSPEKISKFWDKIQKANTKLRIFWNVSMYHFIISYFIATPFTKAFYGIRVGITVNQANGGLNWLFCNNSCDPKRTQDPERKRILEELYRRYPFLMERINCWLDWSSFDNTQSAFAIRCLASAIVFILEEGNDCVLSKFVISVLGGYHASTNAYHTAYSKNGSFDAIIEGSVASGTYITSIIDSLLQSSYLQEFIELCKEEMFDDGEFEMLKIFDICITLKVLIEWFYGDDNLGSSPSYFKKYFSIFRFVEYCVEHYGMIVKEFGEGYDLPPTTTDHPGPFLPTFGRKVYQSRGSGVWEFVPEDSYDGIIFLKTQVCDIYQKIGDTTYFVGTYPWRGSDLYTRLGSGIASSDSMVTFAAKLRSLACLCPGNVEAYYYFRNLYRLVCSSGVSEESVTDYIDSLRSNKKKLNRLPHSIRRVIVGDYDVNTFPDIRELRAKVDYHVPFLPVTLTGHGASDKTPRDSSFYTHVDLQRAEEIAEIALQLRFINYHVRMENQRE
jgi:hypothetical protein